MKKNILILPLIILIAIAIIAVYLFVFHQEEILDSRDLPPSVREIEIYLSSKKDDYLNMDISQETLNKIFDDILTSEKELIEGPNKDFQKVLHVGILYQILKEYDLAKEKFLQAKELNPEDGAVYANLAELDVFYYKDYNQAVENYKKAIEKFSYRADWYRSLADLYRSQFPEKISEIESLMLEGMEKNPGREKEFYSYLVQFFWEEREIQKAIDYTNKILKIDPDDQYYQITLKDLRAELNK